MQVYIESPEPDGSDTALTRFVGSAKVDLAPGESRSVTIDLDPRRFSAWSEGGWVIPTGVHRVLVGRSAGDTEVAARLTV